MRQRVRYGSHHSQVAELWRPSNTEGRLPVVVLIHGGYWKAPYTKRLMHRLAASVITHGWAAYNIEYRRVGLFGGGGGWPATFTDVAAALDHLAFLDGIDPARVITCGHSAGGHLALWAAGRNRLGAPAPGASPKVLPISVVSLAGVSDLIEAHRLGLGGGAVEALLGKTPSEDHPRYLVCSPAELLALGAPQLLVHGLADETVPPSMSEHFVARAVAAGDASTYLPLAGVDHMMVIDPLGAAWAATVDHCRAAFAS